ncbi:DUF4199 domain-containing protein [Arcticibacterium luteifluviistationis]|uniref:DUF4199 domain-containing protein n=1 Tax=Arcticibacterium luteifluviistationis TaxID=1784714 RepID=A0A2Z4GI78_9BACT|nr:DUF4199 domain-containing protein [Arcticibacterium luteifluviistationis]AWW00656.1 hypothetical protein DJ013_21695 [Arcticibacterium luteifluviistationis]
MNKSALKFGIISGGIQAALMAIFSPMMLSSESSLASSQTVGYISMLVALSLIFIGIREHKIKTLGGEITFKQALQTGALIAIISALIYTVAWMIISGMNPELNERIADMYRNDLNRKKLSPEELSEALSNIDISMAHYKNPFYKFGITLLEILPMGLFVSLLASWILRTKKD